MIINTVASAQIHSHLNEKGLIDMHIRPILGNGILSGIACDMTAAQARDVAETLIRLAGAADEAAKEAAVAEKPMMDELDDYIKDLEDDVKTPTIKPDMIGNYTALAGGLLINVNDREVKVLEGMTAHVGDRGPGAYDYIMYKEHEIIMREDEHSDEENPPPYTGPFYISDGLLKFPDLESVKKAIDEMTTPIPAVPYKDPHDEMVLTIAQIKKLHERWTMLKERGRVAFPFWLDEVMPVFGGDGAVTVPWQGMHLCIEKDGYCHS